jgi:transglutaminase/protease-like cytokinesis protein 3
MSCLLCRDFSAPDEHAKRFPKESIPYCDPAWLGRELTAPFDSPTDKARAIFTWLHYNIDYDVVGFHDKGSRPRMYPADTMRTGLAVCQGYAELFQAMATAGGLEAIVVGGHGKGAGYDYKGTGPLPPFKPDGHAWSAVKIDHGQWKLLDACWGAGHVTDGVTEYVRGKHHPAIRHNR